MEIVVGYKKDRQGRDIDLLRWSELWGDTGYRFVRDEVVTPTVFHVRTVWEGINDPWGGAMFAVGYSHDGGTFTDLVEVDTEEEALRWHEYYVRNLRTCASLTPPGHQPGRGSS
jgi:hypothetical protein